MQGASLHGQAGLSRSESIVSFGNDRAIKGGRDVKDE